MDDFSGFLTSIGDASAEGCHLVVFHLGPLVERVVVALGTTNLVPEEDLHGVTYVIQQHATVPQVVSYRRVL